MGSWTPAARFVETLRARGLPAPAEVEIAAVLRSAIAAGRAAHPDVTLDEETFAAHVASRLRPAEGSVDALGGLHVADLWLACACAGGDPRAIERFEAEHEGDLRLALSKTRPLRPALDELRSVLREKVLAGPRPKILEYAGEGELRGWFRVVVLRTIVDMTRKRSGGEPVVSEAPREIACPADDPELAYLKHLYRHEVAVAIAEAAASLGAAERNILREHYTHGLTIDQIGAVHGIHRASAARRIVAARDSLLSRTRQLLMARLRLSRAELESVIRMVDSQMHVSLDRVLATDQR